MALQPLRLPFGFSLNPLVWAKDLARALGSAVLSSIGKGAGALVQALLHFVNSTADPSFSSGWWTGQGTALFERVVAVSGSILALSFLWSIICAVCSGDHSLLAKACRRLPISVLQIAATTAVTGALVAASDEIALEIARGTTTGLSGFAAADLLAAVTGSGVVGLVCGGLVVLGALAVWAELLVRSALIYLAVLAAPLVFAASVHPSIGGLRRRYLEGGLALICSKIVVALAFATGSAMLSGIGRSPSFAATVGALLQALVILGTAVFAPFVLLRLFVGAEAVLAAEGLSRRPVRAMAMAPGTARSFTGGAMVLRGLGSSGLGPSSLRPNGPEAPPPGGGGSPPSGPRPNGGPRPSPRPSGGPGPSDGPSSNAGAATRGSAASRPSAPSMSITARTRARPTPSPSRTMPSQSRTSPAQPPRTPPPSNPDRNETP